MLGLNGIGACAGNSAPGGGSGILTGLRLGFGYAWRALVGAELIAAPRVWAT